MKLGRVLGPFILLILLVPIVGLYIVNGDVSHPVAETQVVIPRGATFSDIATQLAQAGVINSAFAFRALGRFEKADQDVRAGAYRFPAHQSAQQILRALLSGGAQIAAWVTIPEGFTAAQIAQRMHDSGVGDAASMQSYFLKAKLEGYLFPSTYLVPMDAGPQQIADQLTSEFKKQVPSDAEARAKALHVSVAQAVTVASLVEREAKADSDRPLIAGVIYNRLMLKMPLQVDATIEYALPEHKTELSFGDLKIDSPYNTYMHQGLPPTPISNPGRASLVAAFHPARTEALYYVYCGNGHHVFAKTLSEHQANVARCLH